MNLLLVINGGDVIISGCGALGLLVLLEQERRSRHGTRPIAKRRTHVDDRGLEVIVHRNFRNLGGADVSQVEVAGLAAVRCPAHCRLVLDLNSHILAAGAVLVIRLHVGEVDDVKADSSIRNEKGILSLDNRSAERKGTSLGSINLRKVLRQRTIRVNVKDGEETRVLRVTLNGGDQLGTVLAEEYMAGTVRGSSCGRGLVDANGTQGVLNRLQSLLLVDLEAANDSLTSQLTVLCSLHHP